MSEYSVVVVGAGIAGMTVARCLAEKGNKVLVLEQRDHPGGNCYDEKDPYGILIHTYGPHIFHTDDEGVRAFLSRFTEWYDFGHKVVARVGDQLIPVPFNLNTLHAVYPPEKAERLEKTLIENYGENSRVPIMALRENEDPEVQEIADYVYKNVFLYYTMKQWGQKPEDISPEVTGRVPVVISYDDRYFKDKYQSVPKDGFTAMFERMANHPNITLMTGLPCEKVLEFGETEIRYKGETFKGTVIYTGALDELFGCRFGRLPYRSLRFETEHYETDSYQGHSVVNYTVSEDYTRITEYRLLTGQQDGQGTSVMKEYPFAYTGKDGEIPYYPIQNSENRELYDKYKTLASRYENLFLLGRLAEYRYYNIDQITREAMGLADRIAE